jgi:hypothetical protein
MKQDLEAGSMSDKLENLDRLEAALAKLDGVVAAREGSAAAREVARERDSLAKQVAELKQHNADLTAALKLTQGRHDNLAEASRLVGERLDGAIADIKAVLEN